MAPSPEQKRQIVQYLRQPKHLRRLDLERFSRERLGVSRRTLFKWRQLPEIQKALEVDLEGVQGVKTTIDDRDEILEMLKSQIAQGNVAAAKLMLEEMATPQAARCRKGFEFGSCPLEKTEGEMAWLPPTAITKSFLRFLSVYMEEYGTEPISESEAMRHWLRKNDHNAVAKRMLREVFGHDDEGSI